MFMVILHHSGQRRWELSQIPNESPWHAYSHSTITSGAIDLLDYFLCKFLHLQHIFGTKFCSLNAPNISAGHPIATRIAPLEWEPHFTSGRCQAWHIPQSNAMWSSSSDIWRFMERISQLCQHWLSTALHPVGQIRSSLREQQNTSSERE